MTERTVRPELVRRLVAHYERSGLPLRRTADGLRLDDLNVLVRPPDQASGRTSWKASAPDPAAAEAIEMLLSDLADDAEDYEP